MSSNVHVFRVCEQCKEQKPRNTNFIRQVSGAYGTICRGCKQKNKKVEEAHNGPLFLDAHWRGCAGWSEVVEVQQRWRMAA